MLLLRVDFSSDDFDRLFVLEAIGYVHKKYRRREDLPFTSVYSSFLYTSLSALP